MSDLTQLRREVGRLRRKARMPLAQEIIDTLGRKALLELREDAQAMIRDRDEIAALLD